MKTEHPNDPSEATPTTTDESDGLIARSSRGSRLSPRFADIANRFGLLAAWGILIIVYGALRPNTFLTTSNFQVIFSSQAVLLILTLGLLPSLAAGELDLSAPGALGIGHVLVGFLNVLHGWPIELTVIVALGAGLVIGLVNSFFVVSMGIQSIVVTLGMGTLLAGAALGVNILPIAGVSDGLVQAARTQVFGLQLVFYYGLGLSILTWYVFSYTPLGRYLYFVGAGPNVARLSGIRVNRVRTCTLVYSSLMASVAGILLAGSLGSSDPVVGPTFLLPAFASAFLGATAITAGRFNAWGTFIAVYFLVTGITGLELMGLSGWIDQVFYGASLVLAVAFSRLAGVGKLTA